MKSHEFKDKKTLKDRIYKVLKKTIIQNEFPSDYYVTEQEIADEMNVSRTPLREAMVVLINDELIDFKPRKGYKTKVYSNAEIHQIFMLRKMLEEKIIGPLLNNMSDQDIEEFKDIVIKQKGCIASKRVNEFMDLDKKFHRKMFLISKYNMFLKSYDVFHNLTILIGSEVIQKIGRMQEVIKEHNKIILGFERKDVERVKEAIDSHLQETKNLYMSLKENK